MHRLNWKEFEKQARNFFETELCCQLLEHMPIPLSTGERHKFDLISRDETTAIECKSYAWTKSGNYPNAKIAEAQRSVDLLRKSTAKRKIIVFHDDFFGEKSLVETFVRRNRDLLAGVQVWRLANDKFEKFADYSGLSATQAAQSPRVMELVFSDGEKPYFEEQPRVVTGRVITDRRYRIGVRNNGNLTCQGVRVVLESCQPSDHYGVHPGHTLQVMGAPGGTGEFSVHPGDSPSVFVDVVYDEALNGQAFGNAFGLCYSAPVSYAIPRGSYVLTIRLDGADSPTRKTFALEQELGSGILLMRELRN